MNNGLTTGKKILLGVVLLAIVGWFVIMNTVFKGFSGTYHLHDNKDWTKISCKVTEGDADQFSAELSGPQVIKVKYKGEYDLRVEITLETATGETGRYELHAYQDYDFATETWTTESDLTKIEQ